MRHLVTIRFLDAANYFRRPRATGPRAHHAGSALRGALARVAREVVGQLPAGGTRLDAHVVGDRPVPLLLDVANYFIKTIMKLSNTPTRQKFLAQAHQHPFADITTR